MNLMVPGYVSSRVAPLDDGVLAELVGVAEEYFRIIGTGLSGRMMRGVRGVRVPVVLWVNRVGGWVFSRPHIFAFSTAEIL